MSRRPNTSVLLIGADELVRADVRSGDVTPFHGPRPAGVDDLSLLVEAALALGPAPGRQVLVLVNDLWTQVVDLPAGSIRGASAAELEQALKFESEGLSGLPAFDAALGYAPLGQSGGARSFWVTQLAQGELDALDGLLRDRGLKLQGVAHPGGVPAPLNGSAANEPWRRTELWPGVRLELTHDARGGLAVEVEPSDSEDQALALDEGEHQLLLAPEVQLDAPPERHPAQLSDPATLARWAAAWSTEAGGAKVPCVRPAARPLPAGVWVALSVLLAALTLMLCWGHFRWIEDGTVELEAELKQLKRANAGVSDASRKTQALSKEVQQLEAALSTVEASLEAERCRVADLLGALAEAPEGIALEGIDDRGRSVAIRGSAPNPQLPSRLAARLAEALSAHGWRMTPPQSSLVEGVGDSPSWKFTLVLEDLRPAQAKSGTGAQVTPHPSRVRRPGTRRGRK